MLLRLLGNLLQRAPAVGAPAPLAVAGSAEPLQQARAAYSDGRMSEAIALCRQVLAGEPGNLLARFILVHAQMPGEDYQKVLRRIHDYLQPRTYVEIGVAKGETITLACPETLAIGIDPQPKIEHPLTARTRIFAETSDDFFARQDLSAVLEGLPVELAFIDGMHHFEFALRDFINLEKLCSSASTILVHDCFALDELFARRERMVEFWSGDVWKLVLCLKKYRPDLRVHTIGCAPTGLAVIRNLDPDSVVLQERLQEICDEFIALPYSEIENRQAELLNLYPNEWSKVQALLS